MTARFLLLTASLATATLTAAQEWQDLGPTGGEIADILLDDDGSAYAVGRGFFRRETGDRDWQRLPQPPGRTVSLRKGVLLSTGGDQHIHRSVDRGATWEPLAALPELPFDAPAVDAVDEHLLYATTVQPDYVRRVYRSHDDGESWQPLTGGLPERDFSYHYILRADVEVAHSVFLGSAIYGVFASTDAGEHWIDANAGLPCPGAESTEGRLPCVLALEQARDGTLYAGAADGRVYRSDDRAQSWRSPHTEPLGARVVALAVAPLDPATLLAVTSSASAGGHPPEFHVLRSTDGGAHFETVGAGLPNGAIHTVVVDAESTDRAYAATDDGVYASTDGGSSWTALNDGLFATCVYALGAGGPSTTLHAIGPERYWRLPVASAEWTEGDISVTYDGYGRIGVGSERAGIVVAPGGQRLYAFDSSLGPFASDDGGRTWAPRFGSAGPFGAYDLAIDPRDADSIFIAADYAAIEHSRDGGRHWERVHDTGGGSPGQVGGVATDARSGRVYALYDHATFASPSSGDDWRRIGHGQEGLRQLVIAPTDPPTLLAHAPYTGTTRSRDGGRTWRDLRVPGESELERAIVATAADPIAPHILYGVAGRQLYRSDDAGGAWRHVGAQLPTGVQQLQVDPNEPDRIYAATCGAGVQMLAQEPAAAGGRDQSGCAVGPPDVSATILAAHGLAIGLLGWLRARR